MRFFLIIVTLLITFNYLGISPIVLTDQKLGKSITKSAFILEDKDHLLSINEVIQNEELKFTQCNFDIEKIQFTSSVFWLKFDVHNKTSFSQLIVSIARVITDRVTLYEVDNSGVIDVYYSGDLLKYEDRTSKNLGNTFLLNISKDSITNFVLRIESDGENIRLPIIFRTPVDNHFEDKKTFFLSGAYYGALLLISFLYLFYYFGMKDVSFIYYSSYVFAILILQFTLEGYSYFYLFQNVLVLEKYAVVFFAGLASIMFLIYVKSFLKISKVKPRLGKVYNYIIYITVLSILLTFIPGKPHYIAYPLVNFTSLGSMLLVLGSVFLLKSGGKKIGNYFTIAISILVISVITFILANFNIIKSDFLFKYSLKIGSVLELVLLSLSMSNKLSELQSEKEKAQEKSIQIIKEKSKLIDEQNEMLEIQVKERTIKLEAQKEQILEKNTEITDSINYAKRLQDALIPTLQRVENLEEDVFILLKPKDIVSGDFYWITETTTSYTDRPNSKRLLFTAADCTGHGVPGAFISIIGLTIFNQSLSESTVNNPAQALDYLNKEVYKAVNKHKGIDNHDLIKDGMDLAICAINKQTLELEFAGAKNPLYIIRGSELFELKGDRQPIGYSDNVIPFSLQKFQLKKGDMIYASTDGYADQFGGPKGKKYKYKPFKELLLSISQLAPKDQKEILEKEFKDWKGNLEQIDDVCVIGIRV